MDAASIEKWNRFVADRSNTQLRNELLEENMGWLVQEATQFKKRAPHMDHYELLSAATIGAIKAANRFVPDGRYTFAKFSHHPILNEMLLASGLDTYRHHDRRQFNQQCNSLSSQAGYRLTPEEEAEGLGIGQEEYRRISQLARPPAEEPIYDLDPSKVPSESSAANRHWLREELLEIVHRRLSPEDAELIDRLFFRDDTVADIAADRGQSSDSILLKKQSILNRLRPILEGEIWDIEDLL